MTKSQILKTLLLCAVSLAYGKKSYGLSGTQLHGDDVAGHALSSMVLVNAEGYGSRTCGGLLISKTHVLTALHCVNAIARADQVRIFFPKKNAAISTGTGFFAKEYRQAQVVHEPPSTKFLGGTSMPLTYNDYNVGAPVVDVAIIELAQPAPAEFPVFSIKNLATDQDVRSGMLSTFGWDSQKYSFNGSTHKGLYRREDRQARVADSDLLKQFFQSDLKKYCLKTEAVSRAACDSSTLMSALYGLKASSYKILVSTPENICQGDSGSPLFVRTKEGAYKLLGVTSSGFALNGRIVSRKLVGEVECSPHSFFQTILPMEKWIRSIVR